MAGEVSFDVVSDFDEQELRNALDQVRREVIQRYDLKGAHVELTQEKARLVLVTDSDMHAKAVREQPVGQLFQAIGNGVRTMPAYAPQISVEDRWAIVLYVRAMQRGRNATIDDVPEDQRAEMRE